MDSWRHAQAGSQHVVIAAPDKIASYRFTKIEVSLEEVISEFRDVDIILVEGYKRAGKPAIEVVRAEWGLELIGSVEQRIAVVTDTRLDVLESQFDLDDVEGIAAMLKVRFQEKVNDLL